MSEKPDENIDAEMLKDAQAALGLKGQEIASKFEELKPMCETPEQFNDVVLKVTLLEVILSQVNEIFVSSLYNPDSKAIITSVNNSVANMQENVADTYVKNSKEVGELMPIPDLNELASWIEEIHKDIALQLYSEGFVESVMLPALETITASVIEFSKEEAAAGPVEEEV